MCSLGWRRDNIGAQVSEINLSVGGGFEAKLRMRRVKDGIVAVVGLCLGRGRGTEFVQSNCEDNVKEPQYILVSMCQPRWEQLLSNSTNPFRNFRSRFYLAQMGFLFCSVGSLFLRSWGQPDPNRWICSW
jgi:hypothetical protein